MGRVAGVGPYTVNDLLSSTLVQYAVSTCQTQPSMACSPSATADVTGLILAGGASRRFRRDKASYVWQGRSLIGRVVSVDLLPGAGPLAGLQAGLRAARTPWVLVVACDMPSLTERAVAKVLAARSEGGEAVVARDEEGGWHPLLACYRRSILPTVEVQLATGRYSMMSLLQQLEQVHWVDLSSPVLRNVNRPSELPEPDPPAADSTSA